MSFRFEYTCISICMGSMHVNNTIYLLTYKILQKELTLYSSSPINHLFGKMHQADALDMALWPKRCPNRKQCQNTSSICKAGEYSRGIDHPIVATKDTARKAMDKYELKRMMLDHTRSRPDVKSVNM